MALLEIIRTSSEYRDWLSSARVGDRCCYFIGAAIAITRTRTRWNKDEADRVDALACSTYASAKSGLVHLVQQRSLAMPAKFLYIAERIRHPFAVKPTHAPGVPVRLPGIFRTG